ncbi:DgyrCDS13764 [Dimorphilus gyrociliatus]|uniref:DgyrCDS13764 n=1 Tax=Dimorphilus gyrociliatus TaxID=2664684 RepID=A0A7I8WBN6_9ANNE|nr:DgyrCDS13764 [Dimorphilus gyrociliatus]
MASLAIPKTSKNKQKSTPCIFGARTKEIRPVGAWVELAIDETEFIPDPREQAIIEEEKIRTIIAEKHTKLRNFQEEVKRRVQKLNKIKREERDRRSAIALQCEQKILKYCSFPQTAGILSTQSTTPTALSVDISAPRMFEERKQHVFSTTQSARNALARQKVADIDEQETFLGNDQDDNDENLIKTNDRMELKGNSIKKDSQTVRFCIDEDRPMRKSKKKNRKNKENQNKHSFDMSQLSLDVTDLGVEDDDVIICRVDKNKVSEVCKRAVLDMRPIVTTEEEKSLKASQKNLVRKVFAELERQNVRETEKRRQQAKEIEILKRQKEMERRQIEREHALKIRQAERPKPDVINKYHQEEVKLQTRKKCEEERYLTALKAQIRESMELKKIKLPPLCSCAETFWEADPDTCANNCIFYQNRKAYERALQSLLSSFR